MTILRAEPNDFTVFLTAIAGCGLTRFHQRRQCRFFPSFHLGGEFHSPQVRLKFSFCGPFSLFCGSFTERPQLSRASRSAAFWAACKCAAYSTGRVSKYAAGLRSWGTGDHLDKDFAAPSLLRIKGLFSKLSVGPREQVGPYSSKMLEDQLFQPRLWLHGPAGPHNSAMASIAPTTTLR